MSERDMAPPADPEVAALATVADILAALSPSTRRRVLAAAAVMLGQEAIAIAILESPPPAGSEAGEAGA
jgi:hypothetical protein